MVDDAQRLIRLASFIGVHPQQLARHLVMPLRPPTDQLPKGWGIHGDCQELLSIVDGFNLFGTESWNGFHLWATEDYLGCTQHGGEIFEQCATEGLCPIYGEIPHLTSVSVDDGSVLATDWECYQEADQGWRKVIARDVRDYLRTLITVREAYGYEEKSSIDWWDPYATHGTRYDLEP